MLWRKGQFFVVKHAFCTFPLLPNNFTLTRVYWRRSLKVDKKRIDPADAAGCGRRRAGIWEFPFESSLWKDFIRHRNGANKLTLLGGGGGGSNNLRGENHQNFRGSCPLSNVFVTRWPKLVSVINLKILLFCCQFDRQTTKGCQCGWVKMK